MAKCDSFIAFALLHCSEAAGVKLLVLRFYSAAIKAWRDMGNDFGRIQLVKQYFMCIDGELHWPLYR